MKKITLSLLTVSLLLFGGMNIASAQKETKYEKMFYLNTGVENDDVTIKIDNAVSTAGETKFKLVIENKTDDYIIYKPEESVFKIDGKEVKPVEKWKLIEPFEKGSIVVNAKGPGYNAIKNYTFTVDGIYKVDAESEGMETPEFKLPPATNDFKTGPFQVTLKKHTKETSATEAKFNARYTGDKIGFIFPARVSVKMPDGNMYANAKSKGKPILLKKGDEDGFTLLWERMEGGKAMDMQKVDMMIQWNKAFAEVTPVKSKSETLNLDFDEATSNEKGK